MILPNSRPIIKGRYSACHPICLLYPTGLSPFITLLSSRLRVHKQNWVTVAHHISGKLPVRIRIALSGFQSPLLTASQLVSFPPATEMFQFTGFLRITARIGNPGFKGCMRLPRAYRSLPRPYNTRAKPSSEWLSSYTRLRLLTVALHTHARASQLRRARPFQFQHSGNQVSSTDELDE